MINLQKLVWFVVYVLVIGAVCWLLLYAVEYIGLPQPFDKVAHVVIVVGGIVILIGALLDLVGVPIFRKGPPP